MCAGILFSKVNLSDCDVVLPAAISDLNDLLGRQAVLQAFLVNKPGQQSREHVLLQLAVLSMFSMHDITSAADDQSRRCALPSDTAWDVWSTNLLRTAESTCRCSLPCSSCSACMTSQAQLMTNHAGAPCLATLHGMCGRQTSSEQQRAHVVAACRAHHVQHA